MRVMVNLKEIWSGILFVEAKSPEDAKKFFEAMSIGKMQNYCDADLKVEIGAVPVKTGQPLIDLTTIVGYEAECTECNETFNPHNVDDLVHSVKADGEECGGQGEITGWWN